MKVFQIMGFDLPRDGWDGWFLSVFPQNCPVERLDGGRESRVEMRRFHHGHGNCHEYTLW